MWDLPSEGSLTGVFSTQFGWHIGRVESIQAAVDRSFEDAEDELREHIEPEVRKFEFKQLTETLGRASNAMIDFGPLERQAKRQGLDDAQ